MCPILRCQLTSGYAEASGIPYEIGLVKNQYVARTFIQPTPELREQGVRMKLSAVRGVVEGKKSLWSMIRSFAALPAEESSIY